VQNCCHFVYCCHLFVEIFLLLCQFVCCHKICELARECINVAGKELFMTDHSLDDSDVKFLEEGTNGVSVLMAIVINFHFPVSY